MRKFFHLMLGAALLSTVALAQMTSAVDWHQGQYPDAFQVKYAANLSAGPSQFNLTNAGTNGGDDKNDYICANVYVFEEDQQLIACCSCPLSPNEQRTLSSDDLISNTLTKGVPSAITVELVATNDEGGGTCDPANLAGTYSSTNHGEFDVDTVGGLRAWGTTLHQAPGGGYQVTETEFSEFSIPELNRGSELYKMISFCGFIQADGSTHGICPACALGANGAKKQ